jgi:predicted Zn-dependent peptidase
VQFKAGMLMALESSSSTAEMVARRYLLHNRFIPIEEIIDIIDNVSKEDVMKAAQMIFGSPFSYTLLGNLDKYPSFEQAEKYFKL